jgi:hypothetical protein
MNNEPERMWKEEVAAQLEGQLNDTNLEFMTIQTTTLVITLT